MTAQSENELTPEQQAEQLAKERVIRSHLTLRRIIGLLALAFPILLIILGAVSTSDTAKVVRDSMSDYYNEDNSRDWFVAFLSVIGLFLIAYKGYSQEDSEEMRKNQNRTPTRRDEITDWLNDNRATTLAGLSALVVAFVPTGPPSFETSVHFIAAATLIGLTSYMCFFLFTLPHNETSSIRIWENRMYRVCGTVVLACLILAIVNAISWLTMDKPIADTFLFWVETVPLVFFGLAWITKGDWLREKALEQRKTKSEAAMSKPDSEPTDNESD